MPHRERHRSERIGWLRAAVLGANDGIVSTASLVVGVAAAEAARQDVLVAGVAGLVAGALSMAAGEYVSVSSQADTEKADLTRERHELATAPQAEENELAGIYVRRGLEPDLARTVVAGLIGVATSIGLVLTVLIVLALRATPGSADIGIGSMDVYRPNIDPVALVAIAAVTAVVGVAAAFVPARRAVRMDPLMALRHE